ncbi:MAG: DUF1559 domain-containing protein [Planctomycetaceae bacterium]|nr:DUF1559 domain-containing protein [Planctomycetaceae bacterium]
MAAAPRPTARRLRPNHKRGITVLEVLVVVAIIGILIALMLPSVRSARPAARRTQCKNNLKQIGLALHNYHDTYGSLPPAYTVDADGNRLHSWRTLVLPFIEQQALYEKIDLSKPWNDPANAEVFQTHIQAYACPSAALSKNQTAFLAIVGPDTCFPGSDARSFDAIEDGTDQTLLVFETDASNAVNWMEPVDAEEPQFVAFGKDKDTLHHSGGTHALIADGSVRFLSRELSAETRRAMLTIANGDEINTATDF